MKRVIAVLMATAAAGGGAFAAELAYTVRPTEVKAKPFIDASTLASLGESSKVDVLQRQASWIQVKADSATGWVKMLSLRFDQLGNAPKAGGANTNLAVLFNIASTGSGGSTPTTGVKGISEEALRNPRANPTQLRQMNDLHIAVAEVQSFARAGKLSAKTMAYLPAPASATAPVLAQGAKK